MTWEFLLKPGALGAGGVYPDRVGTTGSGCIIPGALPLVLGAEL